MAKEKSEPDQSGTRRTLPRKQAELVQEGEATKESGKRPFVPCDVEGGRPSLVLDTASSAYREGNFLLAYACADLAIDLMPKAVEAHHLRAAALTGLSRYAEAQVAFAMALSIDPNDPETLADVADFYINLLPPKKRRTVQVGLAYARQGQEQASTRRRQDSGLRARLLLLEGQALNDLGDPEGAKSCSEEALQLAPELESAGHELAVSLFNLLRFEEAELALLEVLSSDPGDAYAHHHLGLVYERRGRNSEAKAHFQKARILAPDEFFMPVEISESDFEEELSKAVGELGNPIQVELQDIELEVLDLPSLSDLSASVPPLAPSILGLFRGLPLKVGDKASERSIVFYRKNLTRSCRTRGELNRQIRRTLEHELGHLHGMDEDELRRYGLE